MSDGQADLFPSLQSSSQNEAQPDSGTRELCARLRLDFREFVDLAGAPWVRLEAIGSHCETDASHWNYRRSWFVAGEPPQLLLSIDELDEFVECYTAKASWAGFEPHLAPGALTGSGRVWDLAEWLPMALKTAVQKRRSSFRWCQICRVQYAPENMGEGVCHGCMETYHGVVF